MATSGILTLGYTAGDIVREAFSILGVGTQGDALEADEMRQGVTSLNLMTLTWSANPHLWLETEGTLAPLLSTAAYALGANPMAVSSVRARQTNGGYTSDLPLTELSRSDYYDLPNKTATGIPNSYYFDRQRTTSTLYFWPTPNAGFVLNGALPYTYARKMEVVTNAVQDLDWPQEWFEAIAFNLARRLLAKYPANGQYTSEDIKAQAAELYAALKGFDQETGSVFLQPSHQGR